MVSWVQGLVLMSALPRDDEWEVEFMSREMVLSWQRPYLLSPRLTPFLALTAQAQTEEASPPQYAAVNTHRKPTHKLSLSRRKHI